MNAAAVPLSCWQDPQGDSVLIYSERECAIFFGCWVSAGEPADYICRLSFERAAAVRSFRREFLPYRVPVLPPFAHPACRRLRLSSRAGCLSAAALPAVCGPALQHFVVVGHDIYHEVLAASFTEATIPAADLTDERLLVLHRSA